MLPYVEQKPLWDQINQGYNGQPPFSFNPWDTGFSAFRDSKIPAYNCPSDGNWSNQTTWAPTNYQGCFGDSIYNNHSGGTRRGLFCTGQVRRFADLTDGSSNTAAFSERVVGNSGQKFIKGNVADNPGMTLSGNYASPSACASTKGTDGRSYGSSVGVLGGGTSEYCSGRRWADGRPFYTGFTTVLPPNAPSCTGGTSGTDNAWGVFSATSNHPGGVNVTLADGSVRFISETIECGSASSAEVGSGTSPYGIWGALGSINGGEPSQAP